MARLERLSVRGFKSIRGLEEFELRGLNVLIGANGAGKSNFLDVFRLLSRLAQGRLQVFVKQQGGPDAVLFGGRRRTPSLEMEVFFDRGQCRYRFSAESAGDVLVLGSEELVPGGARETVAAARTRHTAAGGTPWSGGHGEAEGGEREEEHHPAEPDPGHGPEPRAEHRVAELVGHGRPELLE